MSQTFVMNKSNHLGLIDPIDIDKALEDTKTSLNEKIEDLQSKYSILSGDVTMLNIDHRRVSKRQQKMDDKIDDIFDKLNTQHNLNIFLITLSSIEAVAIIVLSYFVG